MQISELMKKGKPAKGLKVKVRVPARLQKTLGGKVKGEFIGLERDGRRVTVRVKLTTGKSVGFRPQDVEVTA